MQKEELKSENFTSQIRNSLPSREYSDNIFILKQKLKDVFDFIT